MEPEVWQVTNEAAIRQRLRWLDDLPPGMIFFEPSGLHFIVVEKVNNELRLVLLEQINFTSKLVQSCLDLNKPLYLVSPYSQGAMLGLAWSREPQRIYTLFAKVGRDNPCPCGSGKEFQHCHSQRALR